MTAFLRRHLTAIGLGAAALLAASTGFFVATAVGSGSGAAATTTITISNGATGATGPAGPAGPPGPSGTQSCPAGFEMGDLVINHPGGQVTLHTCLK